MSKHIAIYLRVSSKKQDLASQLPDLKRWASSQSVKIVFYRDKFTGKTLDRPGWLKLYNALQSRQISTLVVWRLDRLGRTAKGLTALFDELRELGVNLISLKDGIDLSTPAGRMMANVLASVAQFETEIRAERVNAGIAAAKLKGKRWGGSKPGVRKVVTPTQVKMIRAMKRQGESIVAISKAVKLSRPTIYSVLSEAS